MSQAMFKSVLQAKTVKKGAKKPTSASQVPKRDTGAKIKKCRKERRNEQRKASRKANKAKP
jgi:hypothetical protein